MPPPAISPVVRTILSADLNLSADEVIKKAKTRGVIASDASIRTSVHNIRSELKKKAAKAVKTAPAAARETLAPKPAHSSEPNLSGVLANVALVNKVVGACGGVDQARQVAEAVRSCGSVDHFLQHLDLVAGIRDAKA